MSITQNIIILRVWINSDGTKKKMECAEVFDGDVILPMASIEHIKKMTAAFCWLPAIRSIDMWNSEWEEVDSMQRMLLNLAADIWIYIREEKNLLWNLGKDANIILEKHMSLYDDTVAGRRAAELYYRAGYMVVSTFHNDFILDENLTLNDLLQEMVNKWGADQVATAKIRSSCPSWTIIYND